MVEQIEIQEGYKQTDAGIIPKDWDVKTIGDVGEVKMCRRVFNDETKPQGSIPFYKIGTFGKEPDAFISEELYNNYKGRFSFPRKGDILISAAGTIGRTIIYDGKPAYFQDSNIVWIDNDEAIISNDFLYHVYQAAKYTTEGGTIQRLYNSILKSTKFLCPPTKDEQAAISTALNDINALISLLENQLEKKRNIKQGTMQQLLKPKEDWIENTLGETATLKARIGWQGLTTAEYRKTGEYYLITGTEFENGFIDWSSCFYVDEERYKQDRNIQVKEHDVLVTKDGTIGKIALIKSVPKPATLNSGVFVIRPIANSFHPEFFYYLLLSEIFLQFLAQLSAGSTINHLYQKDFVTFKYFTPKTIDEQKDIAKTLSDMDNEIAELEMKLKKYKMIKQGMMQSLLTGKIRIV
ncbi:MAG: restriction endonuclease subunit S [Ferruginibacter sp.]|nr:restriction endonuclease subunit S [Bacteroidota bacterium]MBX2935312.1 restriction endonuclease subunit S [Ferruginibacter sp.]